MDHFSLGIYEIQDADRSQVVTLATGSRVCKRILSRAFPKHFSGTTFDDRHARFEWGTYIHNVSAGVIPRDNTQALKEINHLDKILREPREYEDDFLYPLATRQLQIDLDDGVKVNYNKFVPALKKVTGLTEK